VKQTKADLWKSFGLERPASPRWTTPVIKGIAWQFVRRHIRHHEKNCDSSNKTNLIEEGWKADATL
jgi:hypothetical protein